VPHGRADSEVLRLRFDRKASVREIATACNIGRTTVDEYLHRATAAGLAWPLADEITDANLTNPSSGQLEEGEIVVESAGYSQYIFVRACRDKTLREWLAPIQCSLDLARQTTLLEFGSIVGGNLSLLAGRLAPNPGAIRTNLTSPKIHRSRLTTVANVV
jgi:hypothetical protein